MLGIVTATQVQRSQVQVAARGVRPSLRDLRGPAQPREDRATGRIDRTKQRSLNAYTCTDDTRDWGGGRSAATAADEDGDGSCLWCRGWAHASEQSRVVQCGAWRPYE